jgi:hypothetical protein
LLYWYKSTNADAAAAAGFDFTEAVTPWVHALIAATQFQEFDVKAGSDVSHQ